MEFNQSRGWYKNRKDGNYNLRGIDGYWKQPEIFIGVKDFFKFIKLDAAQELESGFLLLRAKLGPMLAGNGYINNIRKASATPITSAVSCMASVTSHDDIDQPNENDDEQALEQFKKSITKQDGRYQVCWPWENSKDKLKSHYGLCFGSLKTLIRRLQNNEEILRRYNETIKDQLQSGIIEEVHPDMDQKECNHSRRQKAFLQLELHQSDRSCTRFLWVNDIKCAVIEENLKCYRFRRLLGVISSPFLLAATLNHHLETIGNQTELEIRRNLYVDNVMLSANGTRETINKYHEVKDIFKKAAMNIREFLPNDQNFNKAMPK
uniref:Reverse transcriptase domain-containing protein n=1 Tax=Loa loa TaxID=7209 RepID=A0A1I7V6B3_LOALO